MVKILAFVALALTSFQPAPAPAPESACKEGSESIASPGSTKSSRGDQIQQVQIVGIPTKDGYDFLAIGTNLLLAVVGVTGIAIAVATLKKVERQIKAAEDNTDALIAAERSWIVVSVEVVESDQFRFWAKNEGKTPAKILSIWGRNFAVERGEQLSIPVDDESDESLLQYQPGLLPPGARRVVWSCERAEFQAMSGGGEGEQSRLAKGFSSGYIFGRVRYFDVLDVKATVAHETQFLYWLIPGVDSVPFPDPLHSQHNSYT